jgi:hypothetical protein
MQHCRMRVVKGYHGGGGKTGARPETLGWWNSEGRLKPKHPEPADKSKNIRLLGDRGVSDEAMHEMASRRIKVEFSRLSLVLLTPIVEGISCCRCKKGTKAAAQKDDVDVMGRKGVGTQDRIPRGKCRVLQGH